MSDQPEDPVSKTRPAGWGKSELTKFLDLAINNQLATFDRAREDVRLLESVDAAFHLAANNLSYVQNFLVPIFVLRSHTAYRCACNVAMAGYVAETFVVIRSCIEYAGYGLLIAQRPELNELWIQRHLSPESQKNMIKAFSHDKIRESIEARDKKTAKVFEELYQRSIDFGGHPNERAAFSSMLLRQEESDIILKQQYLHGGDLPQFHALKSVAQSGLCALMIFRTEFDTRFSILGVNKMLDEIPMRWCV